MLYKYQKFIQNICWKGNEETILNMYEKMDDTEI
jgi:hypothetical protein